MLAEPKKSEIDHRTIKLLVGVIAVTLASVTSLLAGPPPITSISASYHSTEAARDVFVGSLFAISAFLLAYNGMSKWEMGLSKAAAICAFLVAVFPCGCGSPGGVSGVIHTGAALGMFVILAVFCFVFFRGRAYRKGHTEAKRRAVIYVGCGIVISVVIVVLVFDYLAGGVISAGFDRLIFYGEAAALYAFGLAWLIASRILPVFSSGEERFSPWTGREGM